MQKLLFRTTLGQGSPLKRLRSGQGRARGLPKGAVPFHVPSVHRTGTWGPCTIDLRSSACTGGERRAALAVGAALPAGKQASALLTTYPIFWLGTEPQLPIEPQGSLAPPRDAS